MTTTPAASLSATAQPLAKAPAKTVAAHAKTNGTANTAPASAPQRPGSGASANSSVKISAAGVAALQEARETPAQTAAEARQGDRVAKNIIAKQQAHAARYKSSSQS